MMSSLTNNLELVKYDIDDKVTPSGFNNNFDKIDTAIQNLKEDYVVAQGTEKTPTGGSMQPVNWHWRKWASGLAECWGETTSTDYSVNNAWSGWAYGVLSRRNYPIEFIETPIETFGHNLVGAVTGNPYSSIAGCIRPATATQTGEYEVYRPSSLQGVVSYMKYHVVGRWK